MDELKSGFGLMGRRQFLIAATVAGAGVASAMNPGAAARAARRPIATEGKFASGVSSGLPGTRGTTLWTRLHGIDRSSRVTLEVARDKDFRRVVERRHVLADGRRDFTVHAKVGDLLPGREYFYRFETKNRESRVGRFRTLPPADSNQPVRIGFFSCQN